MTPRANLRLAASPNQILGDDGPAREILLRAADILSRGADFQRMFLERGAFPCRRSLNDNGKKQDANIEAHPVRPFVRLAYGTQNLTRPRRALRISCLHWFIMF
jgi:hypothetical protein